MALGGAAGGAFVGLMIANNIARLQKGMEEARSTWKELGNRGLTLAAEPATGLGVASGKERPKLEGTVEGRDVSVHVRSDLVHFATTDVVAKSDVEVCAAATPTPWGVIGTLRSWLGQDHEVGDEAFDAAFIVAGKPADAAVKLFGPVLRERLMALREAGLAAITCDGGRVTVTLNGVITDPKVLGAAIDAAVEAARFSG